jgi:hypothetical protein
MGAEERVRARLQVERALVRRSLREASQELIARREALGRAVERLRSRADGGDLVDVADAMMAYEATGGRARWLEDRLRQLHSGAEYERRASRALAGRREHAAL